MNMSMATPEAGFDGLSMNQFTIGGRLFWSELPFRFVSPLPERRG